MFRYFVGIFQLEIFYNKELVFPVHTYMHVVISCQDKSERNGKSLPEA